MAQGGSKMIQLIGGGLLLVLGLAILIIGMFLVRGKAGWTGLILFSLVVGASSYHWTMAGWSEIQEGRVDWGECKQMGREKVILQYEGHKYYDYKDKCEKYGPIRIWAKGQWRVIVDQPKGRVLE